MKHLFKKRLKCVSKDFDTNLKTENSQGNVFFKKGVFIIALVRFSSSSFLHDFSGIMGNSNGEFGAKTYFKDHWTANTIQLFVSTKGIFFWSILFLNKSQRRGIPQRLPDKCSNLFICTVVK